MSGNPKLTSLLPLRESHWSALKHTDCPITELFGVRV
jgi:hypothetical protein